MASATVEIEVDLPEGVSIRGYERHQGAHVFEVDFDLPKCCTCPKCNREAEANVRCKNDVLAIRDFDLFGQPSFWGYRPPNTVAELHSLARNVKAKPREYYTEK
jgi:hypothetical protein